MTGTTRKNQAQTRIRKGGDGGRENRRKPVEAKDSEREKFVNTFVERLEELFVGTENRARAGVAAKITGRSRGTTSEWFARKAAPDLLSFKRIIVGLQGDPYYMLGITGEPTERPPLELGVRLAAAGVRRCDDIGALLGEVAYERQRLEWLRASLHAEPLSIWLTKMVGDEMGDVIKENEVIGIDTTIRSIKGNGIYALARDGRLFVRRVEERLGQGIALLCENKTYEAVLIKSLQESAAEAFSIVGRVLFVIKHV